jgi:hypothetical protein
VSITRWIWRNGETFEKCPILFKVKSKITDFEWGKARILTTPIIHRDRHPYSKVFRGLEFEPDAACPVIAFGDGRRLGKRGRFSKVSRLDMTLAAVGYAATYASPFSRLF